MAREKRSPVSAESMADDRLFDLDKQSATKIVHLLTATDFAMDARIAEYLRDVYTSHHHDFPPPPIQVLGTTVQRLKEEDKHRRKRKGGGRLIGDIAAAAESEEEIA